MNRTMVALSLLATSFTGCSKAGSRDAELKYLRAIMPEALLEFAHVEVASEKSLAIVGEPGKEHLGLHLLAGQAKVNRGMRAEVSVDYPFEPGETVRYAWRFMVPADFVSDAPKNRWWLIGQWHDQPNRKTGGKWEGFPSKSPPVAIGLGELNGRLAFSLSYGAAQSQALGPVQIERGKWHALTVVIRWSHGADGSVAVHLAGAEKPVLAARGANMHNDFQHFLKLGMYRHPEIATDNWIYINDVEITTLPAR